MRVTDLPHITSYEHALNVCVEHEPRLTTSTRIEHGPRKFCVRVLYRDMPLLTFDTAGFVIEGREVTDPVLTRLDRLTPARYGFRALRGRLQVRENTCPWRGCPPLTRLPY